LEYRTSGVVCSAFNESFGTKTSIDKQFVSSLHLASIETELEKVEFMVDTAERKDVAGGKALKEIKVFSKKENKYVEDYIFNTSYSTAVPSNEVTGGTLNPSYFKYRLKLNSIERKSTSNLAPTAYLWSFDYNPQNLPSRRSYAQDHWGFFNGATSNNTLLPPVNYTVPVYTSATNTTNNYGFTPPNHTTGVSREGNGTYMQAEILTAIHYPTGGYTQFEYEPITAYEEQFSNKQLNLHLYLSGVTNYTPTLSTTFTITKPQYINLDASVIISASVIRDQPNARGRVQIIDKFGKVVANITAGGNTWYSFKDTGTYTFQVSTNVSASTLGTAQDNIDINGTIIYSQSNGIQPINKCVGGLRIKSIKDNDGITTTNYHNKFFYYDSAFVINPIDPLNDYLTLNERSEYSGSTGEKCYYKVATRNSSTKFSLGSIQGGTIGYGKVTTFYGPNAEQGKTVTIFSNEEDEGTSAAKLFPYPATDSREHRRGLLLSEKTYDAANQLLKETANNYRFVYRGLVRGYKAGYLNTVAPALCIDPYRNCGIQYSFFTITSEEVRQDNTIQSVYDKKSLQYLTDTTFYVYDTTNFTKPIQTKTYTSAHHLIQTSMQYPYHFSGTAVYDSMLARNIVHPVITEKKYNNSQLLTETKNNYALFNFQQLVLPQSITISKSSYTPFTALTYNLYDDKGNLLQATAKMGVPIAYIWGYNQTYPIATVTGANYADVLAALNQTDQNLDYLQNLSSALLTTELNTLRNNLKTTKPLAQVVSYAYAPLIGMTSETDPNGKTKYYEYDLLNRLKLIKDQDGNIVKKYCYNYLTQQMPCD
jgi:YD repeat-containing protein